MKTTDHYNSIEPDGEEGQWLLGEITANWNEPRYINLVNKMAEALKNAPLIPPASLPKETPHSFVDRINKIFGTDYKYVDLIDTGDNN